MRSGPPLARRIGVRALVPAAMLLGALVPAAPLRAQSATCAPARTALVLSGGGTKGLTHLGVLQVLDSLGIVPDLVVGTSMGAIIGALYASGESPASVRRRLGEIPLDALIRSYEPTISASLGGLKPALVWQKEPAHWVLQTGAVREAELNAALSQLMLRANVLARGDFDSLPIPFRAVATDLDSRATVPIGRGDLARAMRASMSIPLLLRPVVIDGRTLVDGGLSSNVPVGVARAMGAERVIVSRVLSPKPDPAAFDDPLTVTVQLFEFLWVQDSVKPRAEDIDIAQPTEDFGMIDLRPEMLDSLVRVGRRAAEAAFTGAGCVRPVATAPRAVATPPSVGHVRIAPPGASGHDAALRALHLTPRAPLDLPAVSEGLGALASHERYRGLWLTPTGDATRADFDVQVEEAPQRAIGLGFAFDHSMSGRIWLAAVDRSILGRDLEGSALFTSGTWRTDLTVAARRRARVGSRYIPVGGTVQLLTEDVRLWQGATELPHASVDEVGVVIGVRPLYEPGWSWELGADYRFWQRRNGESIGTVGARYAVRHLAAGSAMPDIQIEAIGLQAWQRGAIDLAQTHHLGGMELRPRVRAGWGHGLPIHQTFTLGGLDGFAGLRLLEQRGDRELFGSLLLRWPLGGQLHARLEPMVGVTGVGDFFGGPGALDGVILAGARIGVDLETPFGPIRLEEGFNNQDRRQALIRVGLWF
jgi:predicted acylesterase/phospholipase RssA